jgi:hypothetical protein
MLTEQPQLLIISVCKGFLTHSFEWKQIRPVSSLNKHSNFSDTCETRVGYVTSLPRSRKETETKKLNILRDPTWATDACSDKQNVHKLIKRPHINLYANGEGYCYMKHNYVG